MVRPLEQWEVDARARAQEFDIYRRTEFLSLNPPTQRKIVDILGHAGEILLSGTETEARQFILQEIYDEGNHTGRDGVDWDRVAFQIKQGCFSDSDMGGLQLAPRRVGSELTIFRSLMERGD